MEKRLIEIMKHNFKLSESNKLMYQKIDDRQLNGRVITIDGKEKINFSSASYLGLELDQRLKDAGIEAIQQYGTQYSSSIAYTSLGLYSELEDLLAQMYEAPVLLMPTTSLGHMSALPVLTTENDLLIMDLQVHTSVKNAIKMLEYDNVEMISHDDLVRLERRLEKAAAKYDRIWFFADGIYSIFGDGLNIDGIKNLLNKFDNLYIYIDDAHGNSWIGENGKGYALSKLGDLCERIVVITSLNKSFASGGGALICHNEEMKHKILTGGTTMVFSGPIQPAALGVAIASAKIHLSDEIVVLQNNLMGKILFLNQYANKLKLPLLHESATPIFFFGAGEYVIGLEVTKRMSQLGYYFTLAAFPSVPTNQTGLRISLTQHLSKEDIAQMLTDLAAVYDEVLLELGQSMDKVYRTYNIAPAVTLRQKVLS